MVHQDPVSAQSAWRTFKHSRNHIHLGTRDHSQPALCTMVHAEDSGRSLHFRNTDAPFTPHPTLIYSTQPHLDDIITLLKVIFLNSPFQQHIYHTICVLAPFLLVSMPLPILALICSCTSWRCALQRVIWFSYWFQVLGDRISAFWQLSDASLPTLPSLPLEWAWVSFLSPTSWSWWDLLLESIFHWRNGSEMRPPNNPLHCHQISHFSRPNR